jgi:hypothetical protein
MPLRWSYASDLQRAGNHEKHLDYRGYQMLQTLRDLVKILIRRSYLINSRYSKISMR